MDAKLQLRVQRYGWDKASADYEAYWRDQLAPAQTLLLEMAGLQSGERVLDVACGTGLVTFRAADQVGPRGAVMGTDISQRMIEASEQSAADGGYEHVAFERTDAESPGPAGDPFDAALCALGLMYTPSPVRALQQMRKSLKPGGRTVAAVWGRRDGCGWAEIFPIVDSRVNSDVCPLFFQLGTGEALAQAFVEAGYREVVSQRISTTLHYGNERDALGAAFIGGPVAMAYSRFDEKTRDEAHEEYLASIARYRREDGGYDIPGEFVVTRGVNG